MNGFGQAHKKPIPILFSLVQDRIELDLLDTIQVESNSWIVSTCRFYISNIQFLNKGSVVWTEENSYHLVELSFTGRDSVLMELPNSFDYDELLFSLGIDSATNVAGVMGGDLDPTKGMYWTWQSGYINVKIEGISSACDSRNHAFQYHLGGYKYPYPTIQKIHVSTQPGQSIHLGFDVKSFFSKLNINHTCNVMSPGILSQQLSVQAGMSFLLIENE